jgi:hypothetical protein
MPSYSISLRSIFPSTFTSHKWSPAFRLSDQNFVCIYHISCAFYKSRPFNPPSFHYLVTVHKEYKLSDSLLCRIHIYFNTSLHGFRTQKTTIWILIRVRNFLQPPVTSSLCGPNTLLRTPFSGTPQSIHYPWNEAPSSTPIQNSSKITVFLILIFRLLDRGQEDKIL